MVPLRTWSLRTGFALLCAVAGLLLVGIGMWKQQTKAEQWQPLNERLNAALSIAELEHTVVDTSKASAAATGQAELESVVDKQDFAQGNTIEHGSSTGLNTNGNHSSSETVQMNQAEAEAEAEAAASVQSGAASSSATDGRLDLNRATAEQLDTLPGIGPAKAAAIVADRESAGPFRSVDDLARVKGIGPAIVGKLRDSVVALP